MPSIYHLLARQIPSHIQQSYPVFCKFIEYYYRWLQTRGFVTLADIQNIDSVTRSITIKDSTLDPLKYLHHTISNGKAIAEVVGVDHDQLIIRYLTADAQFSLDDQIHVRANSRDEYTDDQYNNLDRATISQVETLPSAFIEHFSKMLDSDQIFGTHTPNIATILRNVRSLYKAKGSERALKYLIKATKNLDIEVKYPWDNVLRLSDGKWNQQYCITVASDPRYWHYLPLQVDHIRFMLTDVDNYGRQKYQDFAITKIEIFGKQSENYDQGSKLDIDSRPFVFDADSGQQLDEGYWTNSKIVDFGDAVFDEIGPYWNRDENPYPNGDDQYVPYQRDPVTGAIIFDPPKDATYGRFGDRYVNAYIRFYVDSDPKAFINQEVRIIEKNDQGKEYVSYVGNVTKGVSGIKVINPGKQWQAGQIFTASKNQIWYTYTDPQPDDVTAVSFVNSKGVSIEYSVGKALIGRVLTVGEQGSIQTVEILQFGDHVPYGASIPIVVSPLTGCGVDQSDDYAATLELTYDENGRNAGFFEDFSGMLSNDEIRIHDSDYYQQFSYDIIANVDGSLFKDIANLLHPAGTKMFTAYIVDADLDAQVGFDIDVHSPWNHVSLVDVAIATEKLTKLFLKDLKEYTNVDEFLDKQVFKNLREYSGAFDGDGENNVIYSVELNYDNPKPEYKWVERTVDSKTFKKTSYVDSGFIRSLHINYDYHYPPIVPTNPFPQVTKGGFIRLNYCDGIEFIQRTLDRFYHQGDNVTIEFRITDPNRYQFDNIVAFTENDQQSIEVNTVVVGEHHYRATFKMPDHDVIVNINGTTLRWPVVVNYVDHGKITPNKWVAFRGETIQLDVKPDNHYKLGELFYRTKILGTRYITNEKKFVMPGEDVIVGGTFVSNGGTVTIDIPTGLQVNAYVNGKKIGPKDFVLENTTVELRVGSTDVFTFEGASIVRNDGTMIFIDPEHPEFRMPNYDVTIVVKSMIRQQYVQAIPVMKGRQARGTLKVQPDGYINIGTECKVVADPGIRTEIDKLYYEEIGRDGSKVRHELAQDALTTQTFTFHLGSKDVAVYAEFRPTGGYVNNDIEEENNVVTDPPIGQWVNMGDPVTVNVAPVDGMTFEELTYSDEFTVVNEDDWEIVTKVPYTFVMGQGDVFLHDVRYTPIPFNLSAIQSTGGTIIVNPSGQVHSTTEVVVTATADDRYRLTKLFYRNNRGDTDITKTKRFTMPSADTTVHAVWDKNVYDLTNTAVAGGTVIIFVNGKPLAAGTNRVNKGTELVFDVRPASGKRLKSLSYNTGTGNVDITTKTSLIMPAANTTITAVWEDDTYTVTIVPPTLNGTVEDSDGSQQAYNSCKTRLTVGGKNTDGPTKGQSVKKITVKATTEVDISLVTERIDNPTNGGVTYMIVHSDKAIQQTTTQNIVQYQYGEDGSKTRTMFVMPPSNVTVEQIVNKKYEATGVVHKDKCIMTSGHKSLGYSSENGYSANSYGSFNMIPYWGTKDTYLTELYSFSSTRLSDYDHMTISKSNTALQSDITVTLTPLDSSEQTKSNSLKSIGTTADGTVGYSGSLVFTPKNEKQYHVTFSEPPTGYLDPLIMQPIK